MVVESRHANPTLAAPGHSVCRGAPHAWPKARNAPIQSVEQGNRGCSGRAFGRPTRRLAGRARSRRLHATLPVAGRLHHAAGRGGGLRVVVDPAGPLPGRGPAVPGHQRRRDRSRPHRPQPGRVHHLARGPRPDPGPGREPDEPQGAGAAADGRAGQGRRRDLHHGPGRHPGAGRRAGGERSPRLPGVGGQAGRPKRPGRRLPPSAGASSSSPTRSPASTGSSPTIPGTSGCWPSARPSRTSWQSSPTRSRRPATRPRGRPAEPRR